MAAAVRDRLDAHAHKTLATLRRDGSPRISGTETIWHDGDLLIGSMPDALKARDLRRDPRFALHSGSDDPPAWTGDAKVAGRAEEILDPDAKRAALMASGNFEQLPDPNGSHVFRLDLTEVSVVRLGEPADHLVIEVWTPDRGLRQISRSG
ncbi:MAG TPA: pyridoxamine 5'-phosphate oxidase family protein [Baekduia sp.]|nr:pyridoxamine 5'-phosphate oxidase family protein [Baekduia sp.]